MAVAGLSRVVADGAKIRNAVSLLAPLCKTNSPKPILRCIHLTASGGKCRASATDLEIGAQVEFDCDGELDTVIPAAFLSTVCGFAGDELLIELDGNSARFKSGRSKWETATETPAEFPAVKVEQSGLGIDIASRWLKTSLSCVLYAVDRKSEYRHVSLGGVFFESLDNLLHLVASDGRRMAEIRVAIQDEQSPRSGIMPYAAAAFVARSLPEDGDCRLSITNNDFRIQSGTLSIYCRQIEGRYPDWRRVFPKANSDRVSVPAEGLQDAVERVAFVTDDESRAVKFDCKNGDLVLSARSKNGITESTMPVGGKLNNTNLDPDFILEFLRYSADESVLLQLSLQGGNLFESNGVRYVIMPLAGD